MSAQQRDALSRGQMSTTTASPARSSPVAGLVPGGALRAAGDDHVVGQLAAVLLADRLHRGAHGLGGRAAGADHVRGDRHRGVGGPLGAADARRAARRSCSGGGPRSARRPGPAPRRRRGGGRPRRAGRSGGTTARSTPSSRQARSAISSSTASRLRPWESSSSRPSAYGVEDLDAQRAHLVGVEHADGRGAAAAGLDVGERVDDHRPGSRGTGRARQSGAAWMTTARSGSAGITSSRFSTSGTWRM